MPNAGGSNPILQDKTVTPTTSVQKITADTSYDGLNEVTVNAMPTATQATPTISINSSTGLITATATQTAGYVAAGTKSATKQLAFQAAQTITPGTTNKTIAANTYLGGVQTIKGDANLVAGNIKNGTSIFGVTGTYVGSGGSGGNTSVEDAFVTRTLSSYTNDRVESIGTYVFTQCSNLTSISFPACTNIGSFAFASCSKLVQVSFPACTNISSYAFAYCPNLNQVRFPACTNIGNDAFTNCSKLNYVSFPACKSIGRWAFNNCSNLTSISFPACTNIGSFAFGNCSKLSQIYLTASSLCTLSTSLAFDGTGIGSNKGSIFVPFGLLTKYKSATNWTYFSNRIFSV